ncbi:LAME_0H13564g1_1 [Lachancea meyersii CBS 8951]|uniref:LAME_0H13564g1_1 n=1 Tax=Lachancea meyersii CBS 8951 TaxID=1266667 RepID=A0A1G4KH85_9SACH|nr:LAME_0H13564g1_1 [Lachancea meyersii CBS 8951]
MKPFEKNLTSFSNDKNIDQSLRSTTPSLYSSSGSMSRATAQHRETLFGQQLMDDEEGQDMHPPVAGLDEMAANAGAENAMHTGNGLHSTALENSIHGQDAHPAISSGDSGNGLNDLNPAGNMGISVPPIQVNLGGLEMGPVSTELSSTPQTSSTSGKVVKRKYSRNGCTECKRRRMKCDEGKPTCWQCARLGRKCVYEIRTKNRKRKPKAEDGARHASAASLPGPKTTDIADAFLTSSNTPELANNSTPASSVATNLPNLIPTKSVNSFDANLLIRNLNDIVNMKLNDSFIYDDFKTMDLTDLEIPELNIIPAEQPRPAVPISFLVDSIMTFNMTLDSFKLGGTNDKYLEVFYYDCLNSIAPFFEGQGNPLRDILLSFAKGEPYLLSSILAVGASISHRKSDNVEDEKSYCAYLSHCLGLLTEQFKDESNVYNKIEPIILTVLMLTWDCIYTMNSQWRSHLKGVTELFKKINSGNSSKVLNVTKCWFKVIETFASISTVLGGALIDESDLDVIFDPYDFQYIDSLKFLNIVTPLNEFNLLRGHKEDFDLVIKEVFKALNAIRHSEKKYFSEQEGIFDKNLDYLLWSNPNTDAFKEQLSYFKIQKILVEIDRQSDYVFIDKTGVIPPDNQSHPENSKIIDNAIDLVTLRNGEKIAISWYDISHQTQVLSFLLIVLLKLLGVPKESIAIQQVVQKITSFFGFLDSDNPPRNLRTCYCNFAILLAGLHAIDEETRDVIRKYYKLNGGRFQRLTEHNLNRLEKVWYGTEKGYKLEDQDVLTW